MDWMNIGATVLLVIFGIAIYIHKKKDEAWLHHDEWTHDVVADKQPLARKWQTIVAQL